MIDLTLSVSRSAWTVPHRHGSERGGFSRYEKVRKAIEKRDRHTCQGCGVRSKRWMEIHAINGDHSDVRESNLCLLCPLCHQCFHLPQAGTSNGGSLIWLPEMTQAQLNRICISLFAHMHDRSGKYSAAAAGVYGGFESRRATLESAFGRSDPALFAQALLRIPEKDLESAKEGLSGIRLLASPGRFSHEAEYWSETRMRGITPDLWKKYERAPDPEPPKEKPSRSQPSSGSFNPSSSSAMGAVGGGYPEDRYGSLSDLDAGLSGGPEPARSRPSFPVGDLGFGQGSDPLAGLGLDDPLGGRFSELSDLQDGRIAGSQELGRLSGSDLAEEEWLDPRFRPLSALPVDAPASGGLDLGLDLDERYGSIADLPSVAVEGSARSPVQEDPAPAAQVPPVQVPADGGIFDFQAFLEQQYLNVPPSDPKPVSSPPVPESSFFPPMDDRLDPGGEEMPDFLAQIQADGADQFSGSGLDVPGSSGLLGVGLDAPAASGDSVPPESSAFVSPVIQGPADVELDAGFDRLFEELDREDPGSASEDEPGEA